MESLTDREETLPPPGDKVDYQTRWTINLAGLLRLGFGPLKFMNTFGFRLADDIPSLPSKDTRGFCIGMRKWQWEFTRHGPGCHLLAKSEKCWL